MASDPEPTISEAPPADAELIERFTSSGDQAAFGALVERHGPLVMGVCLRVLSHQQDAEDAFQAAFVVLARRARKIRKRASLAAWLYGVAYRVSVDLARKRHRAERSLVSEPMQTDDPFSQLEYDFDRQVVDEELQRLPARYRTPLVLYYLGGKTSREIAEELNTSAGVIDGRLKRGRQQLRVQLTRRGVALSGMLSVVCVSAEHATAAVSSSLINSTVSLGLASAGHAPMPTTVSSEILHTAGKEIVRMTFLKPLTLTLCCSLLLGVGAVCVNAFDGQSSGSGLAGRLDTRAATDSGTSTVAFSGPQSGGQESKTEPAAKPGVRGSSGLAGGGGAGITGGSSSGGGGFGAGGLEGGPAGLVAAAVWAPAV